MSGNGGWESWIGRSTTSTAYLDPAQANRMAATLDRTPSFKTGDELPPAWHWLYFHDIVEASHLGSDGHARRGITMPPVPLERRMWAAGALTFHDPVRLGETAQRTSTIRSIVPKTGRTGPMFFVTVDHDVRVTDLPGILETQTIVYRELTTEPAGEPPSAPTNPTFSREWTLDSTALFRYSALTFNGHRIHYDADYVRDTEGYPGLVIHGPLLATLLMDIAQDNGGPLASFAYRARSPLFAPKTVVVHGRASSQPTANEAAAELWAASSDGQLAMTGTANYKKPANKTETEK